MANGLEPFDSNKLHEGMTPEEMAEAIPRCHPGSWPGDWAKWECTRQGMILVMRKFMENIPPYPEEKFKEESGIVISVNAKPGYSSGKHLSHGYFPGAWVTVKELRRHGCTLPITFAYLGPLEWDTTLTKLVEPLGVSVMDLREIEANDPRKPRILAGWESKCYSILHAPYKKILYLDADNIPLQDPTFLFTSEQFKYYGGIFWPDVPPHDRAEWLPECVWKNVGLEFLDEVDFESGQMMIDKEKCWKEINLAMWMNEHSDYFYKFIFGDKSTFHLAWKVYDTAYSMPDRRARGNGASLFQHDFHGNRLFQHCTRNKPGLYGYGSPGHLQNRKEAEAHLEELRTLWNGKLWQNHSPSEEELKWINKLKGATFEYERIGMDKRDIRLLEDNCIGLGRAKMESAWNLFIHSDKPMIVMSSIEDVPTAVFYLRDNGVWAGKWLQYEQCYVTLTPKIHSEGQAA